MITGEVDIADDASIGPYCIVTGPVKVGAGARLVAHCVVSGPVEIGPGCVIHPFATLGARPQHTGFAADKPVGGVRLGANVVVREQASVHNSMHAASPTTIGDGSYLMIGAHVGHDASLGRQVVVCNYTCVAGHCVVGDRAFLSGLSAIHQFTRVGEGAFMSAGIGISMDLPPYCVAIDRNLMGGLNVIGMRRSGVPRGEIDAARYAYRKAFRSGVGKQEMVQILTELAKSSPVVAQIARFVADANRPIVPGDGRPRPAQVAWLFRWIKKERPEALAGLEAATEAHADVMA